MHELAQERRRIKAALALKDINAWVYEDDAGARPRTIEQTYLDELESADLYVGIFWRDFGQYTIEEYDYAERRGKDCLIYEKTLDIEGKRDPRLQAFLDRAGGQVRTGVAPGRFDTVDKLVELVVFDVPALLTARFRAQQAVEPTALFEVPETRAGFVPRPTLFEPVCENLAAKRDRPTFRVVALHGMPGSGKSELAVAAAHDARVRERFPDGVLWGVMGLEPDVIGILGGWIQALEKREWRGTDAVTAQKHLHTLLQKRAVLLVIDDAWSAEHVARLIAGGPRCAVLLTTREAVVARVARAAREDTVEVGVMGRAEALSVLAGGPQYALAADLQAQALKVAEAVGFLPMALVLARAQVADGVGWDQLARDLRSETQRLECLDDAALAEITDDSTRRQLSLVASVTVSLRRLQPERLRQLAWLGVLPDDTGLPAAAAATLWGLDEPGASGALRSLRSSALLLTGGATASGALTFVPHDVIHAMARHLVVAPSVAPTAAPTPAAGAAAVAPLPGLGLSQSGAQRAFLERHRARLKGTGWHTLPDDDYIFDHLIWHLERAGQAEEIDVLLREENQAGGNGWFAAREQRGQSGGYASDLGNALRLAGHDLGRGLRYALMLASLRSIATSVPPALVAALLRERIWTLAQALAYANQSGNAAQRCCALALIAEQQTPPRSTALLLEAYAAAREANEDEGAAFSFVAGRLAAAGLTEEALQLARRAESGDPRVSALAAVVEHLGGDARAPVITEAIEAAGESNEPFRAATLTPLLPLLSAEQFRRLIADAAQMESEFFNGQVLATLVGGLAALGEVEEARGYADAIAEPTSQAETLAELARYAPQEQRVELIDRALAIAVAVNDKTWSGRFGAALSYLPAVARAAVEFGQAHMPWRTDLLAKLPDALPESIQSRALDLALGDEDPLCVARNFAALAPHLDAPLRSDGLRQVAQKFANPDTERLTEGLAAVLPFAGPARAELLEQAWRALDAIKLDDFRAEALIALLPALNDAELGRALEVVAVFDDGDLRSQVIESIAARLPAALLTRALELARAVDDRVERIFAQASLAGHLDVRTAAEVLGRAGELPDGYRRPALLSQFALPIATALVDKALDADLRQDDQRNLARRLVWTYAPLVAAARRVELFQKAVDALLPDGDLSELCDVLSAAAGLLEPPQVADLLARLTKAGAKLPDLTAGYAALRLRIAAWPALDPHGKKRTVQEAFAQLSRRKHGLDHELLAFLAKESDARGFKRLVKRVDGIAVPYDKALACAVLLQVAPAESRDALVAMAFANFDQVEANEYQTADEKVQIAGARVLPYASDVGHVLEAIATFEDEHWRARALIATARRLGPAMFEKALGIARTLEPANRGRALLALEHAASQSSAAALLHEAWSAIVTAESNVHSDDALDALTERLCTLERNELAEFLGQRLPELASLSRQLLLVKLKHLAPALRVAGDTELAQDVYRAIIDVGRWWP